MRKSRFFPLMTCALVLFWAHSAPAWAWDGSGTSDDPYLIKSSADWQTLSANVDAGNSYSGIFFRLTQDIDIGSVSIGDMQHQFSGTFDGDNHTLTYNIGTASQAINDCSAPFAFVSGCTIRHLHTTGTIYTRMWYCAGIVARICGPGATYLSDCHSSVRIWASYGSMMYNGGLVGQVQARTACFDDSANPQQPDTWHFNHESGFVGVINYAVNAKNIIPWIEDYLDKDVMKDKCAGIVVTDFVGAFGTYDFARFDCTKLPGIVISHNSSNN